VAVAGARGDRWLVAYENERLALWVGGDCATHVDAGGPVACVAVDDSDGKLAAGTQLGLVRVYGDGLGELVVDVRPFTAAVRRLLFVGGGKRRSAGARNAPQ
jgi:hypothetical protein